MTSGASPGGAADCQDSLRPSVHREAKQPKQNSLKEQRAERAKRGVHAADIVSLSAPVRDALERWRRARRSQESPGTAASSGCTATAGASPTGYAAASPSSAASGAAAPPTAPKQQTSVDCRSRWKDATTVEERLLLPEWPPSQGEYRIQFQDKSGGLFATGYQRVLYGDHGAYLELAPADFVPERAPERLARKEGEYYDVLCYYYDADDGLEAERKSECPAGDRSAADRVSIEGGHAAEGDEPEGERAASDGRRRLEFYLQKHAVTDKPSPPAGRYASSQAKLREHTGYADYLPGMCYVSVRKIQVVHFDDGGVAQSRLRISDMRWRCLDPLATSASRAPAPAAAASPTEGSCAPDRGLDALAQVCPRLRDRLVEAPDSRSAADFSRLASLRVLGEAATTSEEAQEAARVRGTKNLFRHNCRKRESCADLCLRLQVDSADMAVTLLWRRQVPSPRDDGEAEEFLLSVRSAASPRVDGAWLRAAWEASQDRDQEAGGAPGENRSRGASTASPAPRPHVGDPGPPAGGDAAPHAGDEEFSLVPLKEIRLLAAAEGIAPKAFVLPFAPRLPPACRIVCEEGLLRRGELFFHGEAGFLIQVDPREFVRKLSCSCV